MASKQFAQSLPLSETLSLLLWIRNKAAPAPGETLSVSNKVLWKGRPEQKGVSASQRCQKCKRIVFQKEYSIENTYQLQRTYTVTFQWRIPPDNLIRWLVWTSPVTMPPPDRMEQEENAVIPCCFCQISMINSNHEETGDKPQLRDLLPKKCLKIFRSVEVIQVPQRLKTHFRLKETTDITAECNTWFWTWSFFLKGYLGTTGKKLKFFLDLMIMY